MNAAIRDAVETLLSTCLDLNAAGAVDVWVNLDPWGSVSVDVHQRNTHYQAGGDHRKIFGADIRCARKEYDREDFEAIMLDMLNALIDRLSTYLEVKP